MNRPVARAIATILVFVVSFTTALVSAQEQQPASDPPGPATSQSQAPTATAPQDSTTPSSHQPPVELPDNPGRSNAPQQPATTPAQSTQRKIEPNGTAVAPPIQTSGGAASKPAGVAIAPPKQRQIRSLLIKLGFLAGAGIAVGTVVGLSAATPSRVPNSPTPSSPGH
jgi:hypothetical protein